MPPLVSMVSMVKDHWLVQHWNGLCDTFFGCHKKRGAAKSAADSLVKTRNRLLDEYLSVPDIKGVKNLLPQYTYFKGENPVKVKMIHNIKRVQEQCCRTHHIKYI